MDHGDSRARGAVVSHNNIKKGGCPRKEKMTAGPHLGDKGSDPVSHAAAMVFGCGALDFHGDLDRVFGIT